MNNFIIAIIKLIMETSQNISQLINISIVYFPNKFN